MGRLFSLITGLLGIVFIAFSIILGLETLDPLWESEPELELIGLALISTPIILVGFFGGLFILFMGLVVGLLVDIRYHTKHR